MTTLADMEDEEAWIHFLLIGPSKVGKTDYIADIIKAGFTVLYVDNDNGLMTLKKRLANDPAALARCHYIHTANLFDWCINFFGGRALFRWNESQDRLFTTAGAQPTDKITEVKVDQIPKGVVIVLDSWTSCTLGLLHDSARRNGVSFETFNEGGEAAYGDANRRANLLCSYFQRFKGHIIVQAHPEHYERMEKPKGVTNPKRKDMVIKENIMIPLSVSRPHGYGMAKYFNEVGWMRIGATGDFKLDFRQMPDRTGGGTLMKDGNPKGELAFTAMTKPTPVENNDWIRTLTFEELKAELPPPPAPKTPVAKPAAPGTPAPSLPKAGLLGGK